MCEFGFLVFISVPCFAEQCRYVLRAITLLETLWIGDIFVIFYAAVLRHLQVVVVDIGVHVVAVAKIVAKKRAAELAVGLVVIVATSVEVVGLESYARLFVDVCGKIGMQPLLSIGAVAHLVIRQISEGGECVGETEIVESAYEERVGPKKHRSMHLSIHIDARKARGAQVAQNAILTVVAACLVKGLEHVHHRVCVLRRDDAAECLVDGPLSDADRYYKSVV